MNFAVKVSNVYKASTFELRVIIVRKGKTLLLLNLFFLEPSTD